MVAIDKKDINNMHKQNVIACKGLGKTKKLETAILILDSEETYFLRTIRSKIDGYKYNVLTYYIGKGKYKIEVRKVAGN